MREGDRVKAGQPLLVARAGRSARAAAAGAGRSSTGAGDAREAQKGARPEEIEQAKARAQTATAALQQTRAGARPSRSPRPSARLAAQEAAVDKAQLDAERTAQLVARGAAVARPRSTTPRPRCRRRSAQRDALKQQLDELENGSRVEEVRAGDGARGRSAAPSRSSCRPARASRTSRRAQAQVEAAQGHARLRSTVDDRRADDQARRAPRASSRSICGPATSSRRTRPPATLLEDDQLYVRIYVPETRIGHIKRRARRCRSPSTRSRTSTFKGVVEHINAVGEYSPRNLQTADERADQVFATRIGICTKAATSCAPAWRRSSRCPSEPSDDAIVGRATCTRKFGDFVALDDVEPDGAPGHGLRPARPQRLGQVDARSASCAACSRRPGHGQRARARRRDAGRGDPPADRLHEPEVRALRGSHRPREPRVLRARSTASPARACASAATPPSSSRTSRRTSIAAPACSRAAGSSASRSAPR